VRYVVGGRVDVSGEKRQRLEILVTGGTGYIGSRLVPVLHARGHRVRVLTRLGSAHRVPPGAECVVGDALDAESVRRALRPGDTVVHLVGTPSPSPRKAAEFERVDLASIRVMVEAARHVGVAHLVYVSVAHPAPVMRAYVAARVAGEAVIASAGLRGTILRPWYVLGRGHWWPVVLLPLYGLAALFPASRAGARRLGLVTVKQMVRALVAAVEHPPAAGMTIVDVPAIRATRIAIVS
jgi:nucleoside-diphosphate-sugar epimerase